MPARLAHYVHCGLISLYLVSLTGCAKSSEPLPPLVRAPQAAVDLSAKQIGDEVHLSLSAPLRNTDGSPLEDLRTVEVFRVTEEHKDRAGPLPEEELLARATEILRVASDKLAALLREPTWVFHDDLSGLERREVYARGFRYAVRFVNKKNQTAGLSNQVTIAPVPLPSSPTDLAVQLAPDLIKLTWKPPGEYSPAGIAARILGYRVYRSEDPRSLTSFSRNTNPVEKPEFEDSDFQFDKTYYYAVSVIGSAENPYAESLPSAPITVLTRDTFPPGAPQNLDGVAENGIVFLMWTAPQDKDLAGYRVYRQEVGGGQGELLHQELIRILSFRDERAQPGKTYDYSVAAIDTHWNQGSPAVVRVELPQTAVPKALRAPHRSASVMRCNSFFCRPCRG